MSTKKYDVVAKIGTYQNKEGETKGRYLTVGSILENDGKPFLLLNRHFNPAGLPNPDNRDSVLLSLFEPKKQEEGTKQIDDPKDIAVVWKD